LPEAPPLAGQARGDASHNMLFYPALAEGSLEVVEALFCHPHGQIRGSDRSTVAHFKSLYGIL